MHLSYPRHSGVRPRCIYFENFEAAIKFVLSFYSMSENVPMDHDGEPSGSPAMMVATPSVAAHLSAHTAKRKWVLYAADRFVAQCHEVTCETCSGYVDHLITGVESGAVPSTPTTLPKPSMRLGETACGTSVRMPATSYVRSSTALAVPTTSKKPSSTSCDQTTSPSRTSWMMNGSEGGRLTTRSPA